MLIIYAEIYAHFDDFQEGLDNPKLFTREIFSFPNMAGSSNPPYGKIVHAVLNGMAYPIMINGFPDFPVLLVGSDPDPKNYFGYSEENDCLTMQLDGHLLLKEPEYLEALADQGWTPVNHLKALELYGYTLPQPRASDDTVST